MRNRAVIVWVVSLALSGCSGMPMFSGAPPDAPAVPLAGAVMLTERYSTTIDPAAALTAMATWHGGGTPWLIATAAEAHQLRVFDAGTGAALRTVGEPGEALGQFQYPHRLTVVDNLLLVAERDAPGIQVFSLPDFEPLLRFGDGDDLKLIRPKGLWAQPMSGWGYHVYVADDYPGAEGSTQGDSELRYRVKQYAVSNSAVGWSARGIRAFGDMEGPGRLLRVDALQGDSARDRVLVADTENTRERRLKAYALNGRFSGRTAGGGLFRSGVGGLTQLSCADGRGYWIASDSGANGHYLHLFDRDSLDHQGSAEPAVVRGFSTLWLSPQPLPGFPAGALYLARADGAISALDLAEWLTQAGLPGCRG